MKEIIDAVNDLHNSFQEFKEENNLKLNKIEETKSMTHNRWDVATDCLKHDTDINAFQAYIRKGDDTMLSQMTIKSLSGTDDGGYFIPQVLETRLNSRVEDFSPVRRLSNIIQISSAALDMVLDKEGPEAGWVQETGARDATATPSLYKVKIPVHELYAKPMVTEKLLTDSLTCIEDWLSMSVAKKLAQMENYAFIHGDGNNKPRGFLSYDTSDAENIEWGKIGEVKTNTNGAFANDGTGADKLLELIGSMKSVYLKEAVWLMSRSAYVAIQKLKDGDGRYIVQPGNSAEIRPILFGYPIEVSEDMPLLENGKASKSVVFANFKEAYQIVEHQGTQMLRDPYSSKPFVEFYTVKRIGGDVVNFDAIKVLNFSE